MKYINAKNEQHLERYCELLIRDNVLENDCYRAAMFYLVALNDDLYSHVGEFYDFEQHQLDLWETDNFHKPKEQPWQTGTSRRVYSLALSLYNDMTAVIADVFHWGEYDLEYYLNAIRLRYDPEVKGVVCDDENTCNI